MHRCCMSSENTSVNLSLPIVLFSATIYANQNAAQAGKTYVSSCMHTKVCTDNFQQRCWNLYPKALKASMPTVYA